MHRETVERLFSFIEASPSPYHVVDNMKKRLEEEGYVRLLEGKEWELNVGGRYYVIRGGSSIAAFRIPRNDFAGFQIVASHSDSPSFKIKANPEIEAEGHYVKLNVEKYGGMLCAPWFDRPLSVAGRVIVREGSNLAVKLVSVDRDLLVIPSLAIHMNREANDGYKYNAQKDMLPLYGCDSAKGKFMEQIAWAAGVEEEQIAGSDLFLYNRMKGSIWGAQDEYISIGKLDDLQCAFASLEGFLTAEDGASIPVHCVFDNEEVGSGTKQGADSTFLRDVLLRIAEGMGRSDGQYLQALANSFMVSADNTHAVHPNYPEKACPTNQPYPNGGVVIKYSANQKYATDGTSAAVFTELLRRAEVPWQTYVNRSDIIGGSTLGNISAAQVSLYTVDIGLAQLAMHSPYETGGVLDTDYMIQAMRVFYESAVREIGDGVYGLEY